jgi:hypothetical protein
MAPVMSTDGSTATSAVPNAVPFVTRTVALPAATAFKSQGN